jgi:DNA-directed RNA polymerase specialized sigma24 family protein
MNGADRPDPAWPQPNQAGREDPRQRIRPYTMTAGRTNPTRVDLELEALIAASARGALAAAELSLERRSIVELCRETLSIAEIAARLGIPINVVRILVGDLAHDGLVDVYQPRAAGQPPSIDLLTRVLHGLQTTL